MKEYLMEDGNQNVIDLSVKAKEAGIELPVVIDGLLLRELTPTPFLASLGISLEARIENLLNLVKASLAADAVFDGRDERKACLPFTVVTGPFVREECLSIMAGINREEKGSAVITLAKGNDG
jgi:hypothetical protein